MKPTKYPAKEKRNEARKAKEEGRRKSNSVLFIYLIDFFATQNVQNEERKKYTKEQKW